MSCDRSLRQQSFLLCSSQCDNEFTCPRVYSAVSLRAYTSLLRLLLHLLLRKPQPCRIRSLAGNLTEIKKFFLLFFQPKFSFTILQRKWCNWRMKKKGANLISPPPFWSSLPSSPLPRERHWSGWERYKRHLISLARRHAWGGGKTPFATPCRG